MKEKFKVKPYPHQLHVIAEAKVKRDYGLLWDMGAGKTAGAIHILRDRYADKGRIRNTLVLSPLVTLHNWKREFEMHSHIPKEKVIVLGKGGTQGKLKEFLKVTKNPSTGLLEGGYIFITNYETLQSVKFVELLMAWGIEIMVADEAHNIKNPTALRTKAVIKLGDRAAHRYILTGTPILNSVKDIYALFRFLDKGETFGKNLKTFMGVYMEDENSAWSSKANHFPKWRARTETYDMLTAKIYQKCHRVLKADVLKDLPPLVKVIREVELSAEQVKHYKEMERDFITFINAQTATDTPQAVVAQLAITKALRLQQIVSGFMTTDKNQIVRIKENPRLRELVQLLQEIVVDNGNKCIVWCSFRYDYVQISKICEDLNLNYKLLTGEQDLQQKQESMDSFNNDPDCKVIIANRRAGGIGVNLIAANYSIVYSRNFSLAEELQSEARNHRGGSEIHSKIIKIDLSAMNTIDEKILEALRNKEDISKRIIDFVVSGIEK